MSDFFNSRTLRLERLESRSLLAGGVFDFALAEDRIESGQLAPNPVSESPRPNEVAPDVRPPIRTETPSARPLPPDQNQFTQNTPAPDANDSIALAPLRAGNSGFPPRPEPPQTQAASQPPSAVDAAIAALASESSTEVDDDSAVAQPTGDVAAIDSADPSTIIATETLTAQRASVVLPIDNDNPSAIDDGLIELAPLEPLDQSLENARGIEPWELDRETLPLIRQVAQPAVVNRALMVDQMIRDWFTGPGGLIGLDQFNLPAIALPLEAAMIDVGLESTVSLHRSLNFVADSVTPALSGRVLDAIMASLERVTATETQPVVESSQLRIPTATYPAIAIVATTIALMAHRKHKHPQLNLQFTGGK